MKLNINDSQRFGVEIEYLNANSDDVVQSICKNLKIYNWHFDKEYTIIHNAGELYSGELISPILTNKEEDFDQIKEACAVLTELGAYTDKQCGAHIHFDSNILEKNGEYYQNFLLLYLYYEDVIYEFAKGNDNKIRDGVNVFAKRLLPDLKMSELDRLIATNFTYKDFMRIFVYKHNRNEGVNFYNLRRGKYKTIEFRMPNGTLDPDVWYNNITLFGRLLELAKKVNPKQKRDLYKRILEMRKDLINYYFYEDEKEYEFLTFINNDKEDRERFIKQYKKNR